MSKKASKIRVAIADDHTIVRDAIVALIKRNFLDFEMVGEVGSGPEIIELCKNTQVDVVLMDMEMDGMDGATATRQILKTCSQTKVIALSMHEEDTYIIGMLEAGASGYLLKNINRKEFGLAIREVYAGKKYFSNDASINAFKKHMNPETKAKDVLTQKEKDIIRLICKGYTSVEISDKLFMGVRTVESHRSEMLKKLQLTNSIGLIRYALKNGIMTEKDLLDDRTT